MAYKKKDGFTLIEILVAVVLSGIIIIGLMEALDSLANTKSFLEAKKNRIETIDKISLIMQADIRCKIGAFSIKDSGIVKQLSFISTNSLFFAGSVPMRISYYLKRNYNGKMFLYREEENEKMGVDLIIPLTDIFNKADYSFYLNGRWLSKPSGIIKITLFTKNKKYSITQRAMINSTSIN